MVEFCKLVAQIWHKNFALVRACSGFTWRVCKTSSEVDNHAVRLASVESVCSNVGITLKDLSILIRNRGSLCGVIYLNLEAFHRLGRL